MAGKRVTIKGSNIPILEEFAQEWGCQYLSEVVNRMIFEYRAITKRQQPSSGAIAPHSPTSDDKQPTDALNTLFD